MCIILLAQLPFADETFLSSSKNLILYKIIFIFNINNEFIYVIRSLTVQR